MSELKPYPFALLVARVFTELTERDSVFDLPRRKFYRGADDLDLSVTVHGHRAGTALGPAAGPHSQLAQNIVLTWLGGGRVIELKTVQILDQLEIPRPCIDMATIGYNVEWSQELTLEESLEEYVKASMLIEIMQAAGITGGPADGLPVVFDMSVGYDLAGIQSPRVQAFIEGMKDASAVVERLRAQIPEAFSQYRALPFTTRLSDTLTLSTFHGCPPDEIERIIEHLQTHNGLHCVVKLNPTLLGPETVREVLNDTLGYADVHVPDSAFEHDTRWDQAVAFVGRLGDRADALGLGFGVKFSNTLIVDNHRGFFPASEAQMYLSGPPLHALAMLLVQRFRQTFGDRFPVSFSAGIDKANFADAVALGLVPVTVCSDLLKAGGYGRASAYLTGLEARMRALGAPDVPQYIVRADDDAEATLAGLALPADVHARCAAALAAGDDLAAAAGEHFPRWVSAAILANTDRYVPQAVANPRYGQAANARPPKKVGSHLSLFDCLTCDKCVPVCPNAANFSVHGPEAEVPSVILAHTAAGWAIAEQTTLRLSKKHQIGNFADFCNDCGNCDVFCPEDGGPYLIKPRFFSSAEAFEARAPENGFYLADAQTVLARLSGVTYRAEVAGDAARFSGPGVDVRFDVRDPAGTLQGMAPARLDLTPFAILRWYQVAILDGGRANFVGALVGAPVAGA